MLWVLTKMASWCLGVTVGFTVWYLFRGDITVHATTGYTGLELGAGDALGGLILATVVAVGQYLMIRSWLSSARKWAISGSAGLFAGSLLARLFGLPIVQFSICGLFCFGFDLPSLWLPSSSSRMTIITGRPLAGSIISLGIALGHLIAYLQQHSTRIV
jgi:hypothetical protein